MSEPDCPHCKRPYPDGWKAALSKKRSESLRRALAESDMKLGRKRTFDYSLAQKLRSDGQTQEQIAETLKVSRQAIQRALRTKL